MKRKDCAYVRTSELETHPNSVGAITRKSMPHHAAALDEAIDSALASSAGRT
jgi:ethanolamine utilization microcompartment shell protein EutL